MRISSLKFIDKVNGWELSKIDFFDLTLLVGISGVGKTQILQSILNIKNIADGTSLNGLKWDITFSNDNKNYQWKGEFESTNNFRSPHFLTRGEKAINAKLMNESIFLEGELIAKRENNTITFQGTKMPKLASDESIISLFKEEENFKAAYEGFKKIVFRDHTKKVGSIDVKRVFKNNKDFSKYQTVDDIRNSGLNTTEKLYYLYENQTKAFNNIVETYKEIFPQIDNIKIEPINDKSFPNALIDVPVIQFKENGVDKWIDQTRMSSGMFRTFLHISEMFLLSDGTIVLIDEFENSLGVNCIDVLTEDLIFENNRLQFIATSHHPYIINKIPYEFWKIVTRQNGKITAYNAKDFNLGESNHERFMSLINLPEYKSGIENVS